MSANVLFLTEAGEGIGFGHINRSIALADGFDSMGCKIFFTIRGTDKAVIHNRPFTEVNREWFDEDYLEEVILEYDIIVTDSYRVSNKTLNLITEKADNSVFLIDSQLKHGNRGIILFPSVYAEEYNFDVRNHGKILTGINYLLYTKEMWNELRFGIDKNVKKVGISLGSSRLRDACLVIENLNKIFPKLSQICVFGDLEIEGCSTLTENKIKRIGRLNKERYVKELQSMDLLISNGGQTLNEALLIGLPVLPFITADNQLKNVITWTEKRFVDGLDVRNTINVDDLLDKLKTFKNYNNRMKFHEKCRQALDPMGAIRAANEILEFIE